MDQSQIEQSKQLHRLQFYLHKAIVIILSGQALWSLFQSIHFILIKYPQLEQQLNLGEIAQSEINHLANFAIIRFVSMFLTFFFALKISVLQSKPARIIWSVLGLLLFLANTQIQNFLDQLGSTEILTTTLVNFIRSL